MGNVYHTHYPYEHKAPITVEIGGELALEAQIRGNNHVLAASLLDRMWTSDTPQGTAAMRDGTRGGRSR